MKRFHWDFLRFFRGNVRNQAFQEQFQGASFNSGFFKDLRDTGFCGHPAKALDKNYINLTRDKRYGKNIGKLTFLPTYIKWDTCISVHT